MKEYDTNKQSSYVQYWHANDLYRWIMSQNLPVNNFKVDKRYYNVESDEGYFLDVDVQYLERLHELHKDLLFLPERMKLKKSKSLNHILIWILI